MSASTADPRLAIVVHADRVRVVVVGAGHVAERRAMSFVERGARVRVIAPRATAALRDAAARGALDLVLRGYQAGDIGDAELVVAATDDRATNARVAADARHASRLCNVADAPEEGSFSAVAQRVTGGLLLAVGANGVPVAATRLLDVIGGRFDARYGEAIDALRALRERLLARDARDEWEQAAEQLLGDDFTARVEDGRLAREARDWR